MVVEYPVYPLSNILEQRNCVCRAMRMIRSMELAALFVSPSQSHVLSRLPMIPAPKRLILSGHSSGANICALALLCACGDGYKGSVNIPVGELPGRLAECGADKSRPIVCYCGAGVRAANAASVLRQNGYTNVISAANANALRAVKPH